MLRRERFLQNAKESQLPHQASPQFYEFLKQPGVPHSYDTRKNEPLLQYGKFSRHRSTEFLRSRDLFVDLLWFLSYSGLCNSMVFLLCLWDAYYFLRKDYILKSVWFPRLLLHHFSFGRNGFAQNIHMTEKKRLCRFTSSIFRSTGRVQKSWRVMPKSRQGANEAALRHLLKFRYSQSFVFYWL